MGKIIIICTMIKIIFGIKPKPGLRGKKNPTGYKRTGGSCLPFDSI